MSAVPPPEAAAIEPHVQVAAGLIRRGADVLLVCQQGPNDPTAVWSLPGGVVEPGESVLDALSREIHEETGLRVIDPGHLLYVCQGQADELGWTAFVFAVAETAGELGWSDPDNLITDARFVAQQDAIKRIQAHPLRAIREPVVAALSGQSGKGSFWSYRRDASGADHLVAHLRGAGP